MVVSDAATLPPAAQNSASSGGFISKLWAMLHDATTNNLIHWSADGLAICIPDVPEFSRSMLPQYFKHNNWPSFIRQLNLYGFHRVNLAKADGSQQQTYYFMNEQFQRDDQSLLGRIKRRSRVRAGAGRGRRKRSRSTSSSISASDDDEQHGKATLADSETRFKQLVQLVQDTETKCSTLADEAKQLRSIYQKQQEVLGTLLESVRTMRTHCDTPVDEQRPTPFQVIRSNSTRRLSAPIFGSSGFYAAGDASRQGTGRQRINSVPKNAPAHERLPSILDAMMLSKTTDTLPPLKQKE